MTDNSTPGTKAPPLTSWIRENWMMVLFALLIAIALFAFNRYIESVGALLIGLWKWIRAKFAEISARQTLKIQKARRKKLRRELADYVRKESAGASAGDSEIDSETKRLSKPKGTRAEEQNDVRSMLDRLDAEDGQTKNN